MKIKNLFFAAAAVCAATLAGCDGEKDLIIIEGNLPIKTSTLYLVGDATPNGWSIDAPTPLEAVGEDPLVFTWEGPLKTGEMKLCLTPGSWDAPFIRPVVANTEIGRDAIDNADFKMHAGDPDDKWKVVEEGVYALTFDLRNWKMSTRYVRENDPVVIEPIETETVYMVGSAAPCGWNIDDPTPMEKTGEYTFKYQGELTPGELKMCVATGCWDVPFIRPSSADVAIGENGVAATDFVFTTGPDDKWKVVKHGDYTVELDLEKWTIAVTCNKVIEVEKNPIETETVFMIGDATAGGWSMDDATPFTVDADNKYIFRWEGQLNVGHFKACTVKDNTFSCPFIRPAEADVEVNANGVASPDFTYTTGPDDQWNVTAVGVYALTLDLEHWTITVEYKGAGETPDPNAPIQAEHLYIIGDATPGGWSLDTATELTKDAANGYIFSATVELAAGTFKATPELSFDAKFIRPELDGVVVDANGVASPKFIYTTEPDNKWNVTEAGTYTLTFDLENYKIKAEKADTPTPPGPGQQPIETSTLYIIGDATPGGWSMDNLTALTADPSNRYVFSWEGVLKQGNMKACTAPDGTFACPFLRPAGAGVTIGPDGVSDNSFVYTTEPDDQWTVTAEAVYRITFDLEKYTFTAVKTGDVNPGRTPLETETLYLIGDATPGGWSMDNLTAMTRSASDKYVFTWEGQLNGGELKACVAPDGSFSCPFVRPEESGVTIGKSGVSKPGIVYTTEPDDKWRVSDAGKYRLTINLKDWTITAEYLN